MGGRESLPGLTTDFVAVLTVKNNTTTVGGKIEHSPDGEDWVDLVSFTGGAGASFLEVVDLTAIPLGHVRANMTVAGASADVKVQLRYDSRK